MLISVWGFMGFYLYFMIYCDCAVSFLERIGQRVGYKSNQSINIKTVSEAAFLLLVLLKIKMWIAMLEVRQHGRLSREKFTASVTLT